MLRQGGRGESPRHMRDLELMGLGVRQGVRYRPHKHAVQSYPQISLTHSRGEDGLTALLSPAYTGRPRVKILAKHHGGEKKT